MMPRSRSSRVLLALVIAGLMPQIAAPRQLVGQSPVPVVPPKDSGGGNMAWLTSRLGGQMQVFSENYGISGMERRRPGGTWRVMATPRLGIIGGTEVGLDLLLSSEGSDARQSINQVAFEPTWGWGQIHLGDFSKDYSPYTMTGLRIRGGGLDLEGRGMRVSVQAGRSASLITGAVDGPTYRRSIIAAALGLGRVGERSIDVRLVRGQDALIPDEVQPFDTLGLDTLPADLRPQQRTRPQENLVLAAASTLRLFGRRLSLRGEVAGAVLTRDLTSPTANADSINSPVGGLTTLRASSAGDAAWNVDAQWQVRAFGLRGGYEQVGAGFTSLGLAYLINDRRSWNAGGDVRLFQNVLMLQGRFQRQENNLQSQRLSTTTRDVLTGTVSTRLPGDLTVALVGLVATAGNDESNDTLLVDNRTATINTSVSRSWKFAGRPATVSVAHAMQTAEDRNPVRLTPKVTMQTANAALSIPVLAWLTAAPSVSAVLPSGDSQGKNMLGGLRLTAKETNGVSLSGQYTQTFVSARQVTTATTQIGWLMPGGLALTLQGRFMSFGPQGTRPAFSERFLTTTVGRSF